MSDLKYIDIHRHMGGSISVETVSKISGIDINKVSSLMTFKNDKKSSYKSFFKKFKILDNIKWNKDLISLTIQDVVWGLKRERIHYAEIKFSINKYLKFIDEPIDKFVLWFINEFDVHASNIGITVDLILSLKHDMDKDIQLKISNIIKKDLIAECIAGIDIVGDENYFDVGFYKPIYKKWHDAGKVCMAHVGEINKPNNVIDAINILKVDRICHGISVSNNKELAKITRDKLISFDVCLTSNFCTGVAKKGKHPVKEMIENGFIINIGTDDPSIVCTNIQDEYSKLKIETGLNDGDIELLINNAFNFSAQEIIKRKKR